MCRRGPRDRLVQKQPPVALGSFPTLNPIKRTNPANIKSLVKRIGTNKKSQDRNTAVKSEIKTATRATHATVADGDTSAALIVAAKKLDKAASKGVLHENRAANRKSSIAKQVPAL